MSQKSSLLQLTRSVSRSLTPYTKLPNVNIERQLDWQRSTTFRLAEIEDADFILFPIVRDPLQRAQRLAIDPVDSYAAEQRFFGG